jgi:hypothetical protein
MRPKLSDLENHRLLTAVVQLIAEPCSDWTVTVGLRDRAARGAPARRVHNLLTKSRCYMKNSSSDFNGL